MQTAWSRNVVDDVFNDMDIPIVGMDIVWTGKSVGFDSNGVTVQVLATHYGSCIDNQYGGDVQRHLAYFRQSDS